MIIVLSIPSPQGSLFSASFSFQKQSHCLPSHPRESEGCIGLRNYGPYMFCSTTLSAPNAQAIRLEFVDVDVSDETYYLSVASS
ncbi:unnamed protein product [Dicrocoelium dendriticum]|nr:unnamed protein product [Dicrocoelium dendriticum]